MRRYRVTYVEYDVQTDKTIEEMEALERGDTEPAEPSYRIICAETEKEAWTKFREWASHLDYYAEVLYIEDEGEVRPIQLAKRKEK